MDKHQALTILNLSNEDTPERLQERYRDRFNDLQVKITNAPPNMRSVFEKNLRELEEAYICLSGLSKDIDSSSLPSKAKVDEKSLRQPEENLTQKEKKPLKKSKSDLSSGTNKWLYFTTFFFFSLAASQFGMWYKANQRLKVSEPLAQSGEIFQTNYVNSPFSVSNEGDEAFYILHLTLFYIGENDMPQTFGYQGDPVLVESGKSYEAPGIVKGTNIVFDGSGIAYSILLADASFSTYKAYEGLIPAKGKIPLNPDFD